MKLLKHQESQVKLALDKLTKYNIVYLAFEMRVGKTLTSLVVADKYLQEKNLTGAIVVVVKSQTLKNVWLKALKDFGGIVSQVLVETYSTCTKVSEVNIVIIDEAHAYISNTTRTARWFNVRELTRGGVPIIYLSGTPYAQGSWQLFNQLALSDSSPWSKYSSYNNWFYSYCVKDKYGNIPTIRIGIRTINDLKNVQHKKVLGEVKHLFLTLSQTDADIEHQATDDCVYIELNDSTKNVYNKLKKDKFYSFKKAGGSVNIACDTPMTLQFALHMLEGGGVKDGDDTYHVLSNTEKVDYILDTFGDVEDLAIAYAYKVEAIKLEKHFKKAKLLQYVPTSEGIDLSKYKHFVVFSQTYSTAKHIQIRARQVNINRKTPVVVTFLLVKGCISELIYKTISKNKEKFMDDLYKIS